MRPRSIVIFEFCYLGAVVLGLLNTVLNWSKLLEMPGMAALVARWPWYMPTVMAFSALISLLLWYFVARRASVVAKWIVVVFYGFSAIGIVIMLATGLGIDRIAAASLFLFALNGIAVWQLFRRDALAWFAARRNPVTPGSLDETFS